MKARESFSVSESFGLKDLSLEEIENINGGESVSIGECNNMPPKLGPIAVNEIPLGGSIISVNPIPINQPQCANTYPYYTPSCGGGGGTATPICGGGSSSSGSSSCGGGK